jgi:hypothetical protein
MADPVQSLTFFSWVRERTSGLATTQTGGRVQGAATVTLTARDATGMVSGSETRLLSFLLTGPADVTGLGPGAIARRYPSPGTLDHESDRCPYVELGDASLAWRYTPAATPAASSPNLHPWLVLVVGEEGTELTLTEGGVTIDISAQTVHALGIPSAPYRFAHVQADAAGHRTARVLSGRPLRAGTDYLAVVVPAYDESGGRSWTGVGPVTVPVYDAWRFRTAVPAGSFEDLAARLRPGQAPGLTGRAPVRYPRLDDAPALEVLGALVAVSPEGRAIDEPLPAAIEADLVALQLPARDPEGRPIVALPRYGEAWQPAAPDDSVWGRSLNRDPRHRGVVGLGLEVGIRFQEELVSDVLAHLGALQEARQRVRHAIMGVAVSRSLWQRRIPAEPAERLWILGPALSRLTTDKGTVADLATSDDRTIARGTFSAAARRVLRSGPARTTVATAAPTPAAVLAAVNRKPFALPSTVDGLPLENDALADFDRARERTIRRGAVEPAVMLAAASDLAGDADERVQPAARQIVTALREAASTGRAVPWEEALTALASGDAEIVRGDRDPTETVTALTRDLSSLRTRVNDGSAATDVTSLLTALSPLAPNDPPVAPVDINTLSAGLASAFDPTGDRPPVFERILKTIRGGIDPAQPLAPPEPCVGLDRPAWADLERGFDEWLLPGVGQLPADSVIGLETNAVFVDAFLTGLNSQLLAELRWRNIPIASGCTPIRRFWDRADSSNGTRTDDIVGLKSWTIESRLGDPTHAGTGTSSRELVIAVRGDLFLRYPSTLVYLKSARHGQAGAVNFEIDPEETAPRILPGFRGRLAEDVAFFGFPALDAASVVDHWVVFEEPPAGYRFANDAVTAALTGHAWAEAALVQPVRVLIRGDSLIAGAH